MLLHIADKSAKIEYVIYIIVSKLIASDIIVVATKEFLDYLELLSPYKN